MSVTVAAPPPIKNFEDLRPEVTDALLADITRRIVEKFAPEKIILFGSYAYGKPHIYSDVDLFVVMNSEERMAERIRRVHEEAYIDFLPIDVIVRTPAEITERLALGDSFVREIVERGKVIYLRGDKSGLG